MHYHMQNEEYGKVVEACKRYGDQEVCLWEQALGYFARKEEDCKAYISQVLQHIDQNNLMPPLLGEPHLYPSINQSIIKQSIYCSKCSLTMEMVSEHIFVPVPIVFMWT